MRFDSKKSYIMGVLNITPDSFSDGNLFYNNPEEAVEHALQMQEDGADIIDIGGESSKPGSDPVSIEEELRRVLPVIKILSKKLNIPISIDTYKPKVANEAIVAGARIINDITGLTNPDMVKVAAKKNTPVIIMHMQGEPKTMQENPRYNDVIKDIHDFFESRIKVAKKYGLTNLILDPGIGFGKTKEHNLTIIKHLDKFKDLEYPILVGPSRKSFLGAITGSTIGQRLESTIAAVTIARLNGANILRVHDVAACKKALRIADAIINIR